MSKNVEIIRPDESLCTAAEMMRRFDIGAIPVCTGDKVIGMITDRDIVVRGISQHRDPEKTPVKECLSAAVQWCFEDDSLHEASERMKSHQIRRLIVVDQNKKLVGMLSLGDVSGALRDADAGDVLESISAPASDV